MNQISNVPSGAAGEQGLRQNNTKNVNSCGDMPDLTHFSPRNITVAEIASYMPKPHKERIISGYDLKSLAKVFEDASAMSTVDGFLKYGLNVSETARRLYMHRNTLIYRLNKIQSLTGLDIRRFDNAVTFEILRCLYRMK